MAGAYRAVKASARVLDRYLVESDATAVRNSGLVRVRNGSTVPCYQCGRRGSWYAVVSGHYVRPYHISCLLVEAYDIEGGPDPSDDVEVDVVPDAAPMAYKHHV